MSLRFDRLPRKTGGTKMVNRINTNTPRENNQSTETKASAAQRYSNKNKSAKGTNPVIDEVIALSGKCPRKPSCPPGHRMGTHAPAADALSVRQRSADLGVRTASRQGRP